MFASQETYVPSAHLEGGAPAPTDYAVNQGMYSVPVPLPSHQLFWVKRQEMTEGRKAGRASKSKLPPSPPSTQGLVPPLVLWVTPSDNLLVKTYYHRFQSFRSYRKLKNYYLLLNKRTTKWNVSSLPNKAGNRNKAKTSYLLLSPI